MMDYRKSISGFYAVLFAISYSIVISMIFHGILFTNYTVLILGIIFIFCLNYRFITILRRNKADFVKICDEFITYQKTIDGEYISFVKGHIFQSSFGTKEKVYKEARKFLC